MSHYRVCLIEIENKEISNFIKFDNKEDAEHFAKNKSTNDSKHLYEIQKNDDGDFTTIKSYRNGEEN